MVSTTINQIVNNMLLQRRYSLHWYLEFLLYGIECVRELSMDDLMIMNTKVLPVNSTSNTAELPSDYLDYVMVGVRVGQNIMPLVESDLFDNANNFSSDYTQVKYNSQETTSQTDVLNPIYGAYGFSQWFTTHYNNFGEQAGKFYGGISYYDTFQIIKGRNVIKINEGLSFDNIVLIYIGNGLSVDAVSSITPYATQTIQEYILFKFKENNRTYSPGEAQAQYNRYTNARQILRARMSDLSLSKLKRIVHRTTIASPKN